MLHERTKEHISNLNDAELLKYVAVGTRMYDADAIAFARSVLASRDLSPEQKKELRSSVEVSVSRTVLSELARPDRKSSPSVVCQMCGVEAPTRFAEFNQNIGAFVMRMSEQHRGWMCRQCGRKYFRKCTMTTMVCGWWGVVSFPLSIGFVIGNIVAISKMRSLPEADHGAVAPQCDDDVIAHLATHANEIVQRLDNGEDVNDISRAIAPQASVTPGQAFSYIKLLLLHRAGAAGELLPKSVGFPIEAARSPQ